MKLPPYSATKDDIVIRISGGREVTVEECEEIIKKFYDTYRLYILENEEETND